MPIVDGEGTQLKPFNWPVRFILKLLIKDPRISVNKINNQFSDFRSELDVQENERIGRLVPDVLQPGGALSDVVTWRIDLKQLKYRDGGGTCLVSVKLKKNNEAGYEEFEKAVQGVDGVIEWDQISGESADYLVRVAGRVASSRAKEVMIALGELSCVERSFTNPATTVWRSGVVDNFSPDDFLEIVPYPNEI